MTARWVRHAIFWHIYPLGFVGAEPEATVIPTLHHRLGRIEAWLDYAVRLGASGLLLGPIFAASSHGYDTIDPFRIDPRLGDDADFDALIAAARQRGLRVVLDGVFNHVGRAFPAFQTVLRDGPSCPEAEWFRIAWPSGWQPGQEPDVATFEGHHALVALNHDSAAVRDHVTRVMIHWLDRGASGWRLDAAYAVPCSFWAEVLPRVRQAHPDAFLFGEVIHGDYATFVRDAAMDSVTQYELWKAIWSALNDGNLFELAWALERHNHLLDTFVPVTFVGNHDVTRLASRLTERAHVGHALAVLLTVGGTPCIYAGDEQAFQGVKEDRAGGDDAIRPAFPATPDGLAPYGQDVFRLHQQLIGLRRRHPWLHAARTRMLTLRNRHMVFEATFGDARLLVALNIAPREQRLAVPGATSVLAGSGALASPDAGGAGDATIRLPPQSWAVLGTDAGPG